MINSEAFTERLKKIIDHYSESASSFAESIGVQRSSISHILSGRNKPSLDFIMKVLDAYPDVELYWLLNGKGTFPKTDGKPATDLFSNQQGEKTEAATEQMAHSDAPLQYGLQHTKTGKAIARIVIFYKDGSFESYE